MGIFLREVSPNRAQYRTGEEVVLIAALSNPTVTEGRFLLLCEITHLDKTYRQVRNEIILPPGCDTVREIGLGCYDDGARGYGVDISLYEGDALSDAGHTAFDVTTLPGERMRYGFLSDFGPGDTGSDDVDWLRRMHINYVQFYDWAYRHHDLVSETEVYADLMGKVNSLSTIWDKIDKCHRFGIRALGYGAVYAAGKEFYIDHPEWALREANGDPLIFIDTFYYMDIRRECPWYGHIVEEYKKAVACLGFDGIHMDTYGFPKRALSDSTGKREAVKLDAHFPGLIEDTYEALSREKDIDLIFNCVGNWPPSVVAGSPVRALYIEVWDPYSRYHHIQTLIKNARQMAGDRPVILAAYLAPFRFNGPEAAERAETAALLLTAAITSCGASHLLVGEDRGVLTQGYYADYTPMRDSFAERMEGYYDFIVRYGDIFFDRDMEDVSMTHTGWDNREYVFSDMPSSSWGEAGRVWTIIREGRQYRYIGFINLTACGNDCWNEGKEPPGMIEGMTADILSTGEEERFIWASPDQDGGRAKPCPYTIQSNAYGQYMTLDIPSFSLWGLLICAKAPDDRIPI